MEKKELQTTSQDNVLSTLEGMKKLIEQQSEALKQFKEKAEQQENQIKSLTASVAEANSRAENAISASTG